jgi:beta-lactam-binding protein with PASTA domain
VLLFMQNLLGTAPPIVGDLLPDVIGQTYLQAVTTLGNLGFLSFTIGFDFFESGEYSDSMAVDLVLEQSPQAGVYTLFTDFVTLTRSLGAQTPETSIELPESRTVIIPRGNRTVVC